MCQGEPIKCYTCGEAGHKANYCPKKQGGNQPGQNGHNKGYNNMEEDPGTKTLTTTRTIFK